MVPVKGKFIICHVFFWFFIICHTLLWFLLFATGESKSTLKSFTREDGPNPFNPRLLYLLEHLDKEKISAIKNRKTRGEITREEMMKLLIEVFLSTISPVQVSVRRLRITYVRFDDKPLICCMHALCSFSASSCTVFI